MLKATQEQVRKMVEENVLCNVSTLINNLYADDKYADELYDLFSKPDYESAAIDAGWTVIKKDGKFCFESKEDGQCGGFYTEQEAWLACCSWNDIEPYQTDVNEHYIVSEWLADKLLACGEVITYDFMDLIIWGRTAGGQVVWLDSVMERICSETSRYMTQQEET